MKGMMLMMLCVLMFASAAIAQTTETIHPTTSIVSVWNEYQTTDGGLDNFNVWANVWPSDGKFGFYLYTQGAQPSFTQTYGGPAVRMFDGQFELGAGLGVENVDGNVGLRRSVYGIVTHQKFSSANWYESSRNSGWWFLTQDMYSVTPTLEAGYRLQRFLGGGPMVRYTATFKNWAFQPYGAALYDGDRLNPILGFSMTHK